MMMDDGDGYNRALTFETLMEESVDHDFKPKRKSRNKCLLALAFFTFTLFAIAEVLAALIGNSLSLLSDALTMLVDAFSYLLNWWAEYKKENASQKKILQLELIAPSFSVFALIATTAYITVESVSFLLAPPCLINGTETTNFTTNTTTTTFPTTNGTSTEDPCAGEEVNISLMWIFSSVNLFIDIVNIFFFAVEYCRHKDTKNLNMLSALTHVAIDTLRSLSVFAAALASSNFGIDGEVADAWAAVACSFFTMCSVVPLLLSLNTKWYKLKNLNGYNQLSINSGDIQL